MRLFQSKKPFYLYKTDKKKKLKWSPSYIKNIIQYQVWYYYGNKIIQNRVISVK